MTHLRDCLAHALQLQAEERQAHVDRVQRRADLVADEAHEAALGVQHNGGAVGFAAHREVVQDEDESTQQDQQRRARGIQRRPHCLSVVHEVLLRVELQSERVRAADHDVRDYVLKLLVPAAVRVSQALQKRRAFVHVEGEHVTLITQHHVDAGGRFRERLVDVFGPMELRAHHAHHLGAVAVQHDGHYDVGDEDVIQRL
mmetsp:Transcript_34697/g.76539  ORF Transcript_34697/g.76539 Transcript_34697/m.76539 type:complete len:200 (-) Transcript_34697:1107-1706(-)